jgi:serine/threonine protein kinase
MKGLDRYCLSYFCECADDQIFARKIVRIFGDITHEDAESEGRMLSDLCRPGGSNTVVEVTKHGWLPRHPSLYYMDMEYCLETLESRIHGAGQKSEIASTLDSEIHEGEVDSLSTGSLAAASSKIASSNDPNESPPEFDWQSVVNIIEDINRGLIYLHQNKTVHRDLKPKNGTELPDTL